MQGIFGASSKPQLGVPFPGITDLSRRRSIHITSRIQLTRNRDMRSLRSLLKFPAALVRLACEADIAPSALPRQREQAVDVDMFFDVLGERFKRALDPVAIALL